MARRMEPQHQIDNMANVRLETLGQSWEQINDKPINLGVSCFVCEMEEVEGREAAEKEDE